MIWALVLGAGIGLGVWQLLAAAVPARSPLQVAVERLHRPADPMAVGGPASLLGRLGRLAIPVTGGVHRPSLLVDLAVIGEPVEVHVGRRVFYALVGLAYAPLLTAVASAAGVSVPWVLPAWVSVVFGVVGFMLPDASVRRRAAARRAEFRYAMGAFTDVLVMLLAANEGPVGALDLAAHAGRGWVFAELQRALFEARVAGEAPWLALDRLGVRYAIPELRELAAAAELAGTDGAAVRESLMSKARALRTHALAADEAAAESASARMTLPLLLMMASFLLYVGYPAVMEVLRF